MARINPETLETAPEASRPTMEALKKGLGMLPNLFATIAKSPASLDFAVSSMQKFVKDITKPTVQKPHCVPEHSTIALCTGVSSPFCLLMPSTVTMCLRWFQHSGR